MKTALRLLTSAALFCGFLILAPAVFAQKPAEKLQALSQQLQLTPEQKAKLLPILEQEDPSNQEKHFASTHAEDETTPRHSRGNRAGVAENSFAGAVPKATSDSPGGNPASDSEQAWRRLGRERKGISLVRELVLVLVIDVLSNRARLRAAARVDHRFSGKDRKQVLTIPCRQNGVLSARRGTLMRAKFLFRENRVDTLAPLSQLRKSQIPAAIVNPC